MEVHPGMERGNGGINVDGDYEGLMSQRKDDEVPPPRPQPKRVRAAVTVKSNLNENITERALRSVKDKKWSLPDAIFLYGTLDQVQQWASSHTPTNGESQWTATTLEAERANQMKKIDASTRTSAHKLYTAFAILEGAARKLQLHGYSDRTLREAIAWFAEFVTQNDGLRVRGISVGSSSLAGADEKASTISLSLLAASSTTATPQGGGGAKATAKGKSSSLATELHRYKQYASLGAAVLYLAAKRTGVGRTLTEVCSAFGTFSVIPNGDASSANGGSDGRGAEPLVRPKHCSRAMQELRAVLPEVVSPAGGQGMAAAVPSSTVSSMPSGDVAIKNEENNSQQSGIKNEENDAQPPPAKVSPAYGAVDAPLSSSNSPSPVPIKSEHVPDAIGSSTAGGSTNGGDVATVVDDSEEAALADLISRMATSLNLPQCAISMATAVAIRCARDARASSARASASPKQNNNATKSHIRPRQRKTIPRIKRKDTATASPDVIAISSILLVCTVGGTMQRLARQALASNSNNNNAASSLTNENVDVKQQRALSSWRVWNDQPSWHRNVSHFEQCTGVPRKTIVAHYSKAVHPRRSYFLGVAATVKDEMRVASESDRLLLCNIVAAVPLMSLRNL